ncbi:MAG TPA: DNA gyrase subunit A [Caldisericia bacterium]|nr:MAG: DNA gyrase subunit A [bacterium ADurb.Bin132]HNY60575.1 DNA gyrase subunit A [Caldisericia bacterium]HOC79299.1 DNA gyrase subunit A [Caldisericia bacterium]HOG70986.1 DNA gyrase subunit A [Caldisericia bacterium]HPA65067.1 DNA gyrase subunit A [Caldisericia bacterium]
MEDKDLQNRLGEKVREIEVEEEIKTYYLDYAMSVNIGRSIPDARDGLKPVHRRILFSMGELGNNHDKPHKKSARIVGDVLGKYHPHGDVAVYDSLVRLAQEFSSRYPLVDGQGNFGSIDGDGAAAMRYTEVRLTEFAESMLEELDQETVQIMRNFDNTLDEPTVLPSKLPVLLLNGSSGIGVGMASNIPPHNLGEVVDCLIYMLDNSEPSLDDIMRMMPGPDFPTGGRIVSPMGIRKFYEEGRGTIIVQGIGKIESEGKKLSYVINELPYMVNKATLVSTIADLVREKKIEGITDLRDESDREGIRVVIEIKLGADPQLIEKQLYKHTAYQSTFGGIMLSIVDGRPMETGLINTLNTFLNFRRQVVTKRTEFQLKKAEERKHILEGIRTAITNIDETIKIIRNSPTSEAAQTSLIQRFQLSDIQAKAILDMRLARLTALEVDKIDKEIAELIARIKELTEILENPERLKQVVREEFLLLKKKFADKRRTIIENFDESGIKLDDLIPDDPFIVSITKDGYLKRVKVDAWRAQGRGGKGVTGVQTVGDDQAQDIFHVTAKQDMLTFTNLGKVYKFKVYDIPETGRAAKGTPITAIIPLTPSEFTTYILPVKQWDDNHFLMFVTAQGTVKKVELSAFANIRRTGIIAITLDADDWLRKARLVNPSEEIIIVSKHGQAVRFNEGDIRPTGRSSKGVIGIRMGIGDMVMGMEVEEEDGCLLCVSENGYGKLTDFDTFRLIKRGGKGVRAMNINDKSGPLVACNIVKSGELLMIITTNGQTIRISTSDIPELGRYATGVRLIKLEQGDTVTAISRMTDNGEDETAEPEEPGLV